MRFIYLTIRNLKIMIRDRKSTALILLLPLFFMIIFSLAFNQGPAGVTTYDIIVINNDSGKIGNRTVSEFLNYTKQTFFYANDSELSNITLPENFSFGANFTAYLKIINYTEENSGKRIFNVLEAPEVNDTILDWLKDMDYDAIVIIGENFSAAVMAKIIPYGIQFFPELNVSSGSDIIVQGDASLRRFNTVSSIIGSILHEYIKAISNRSLVASVDIAVRIESIIDVNEFTAFDFIAPGIMIFAIMMNIIHSANLLTRDIQGKTLTRLKLSKARGIDILLATLVTYTILSIVQIFLMFAGALAVGFHYYGNILYGIIIALLMSISCVGLGFIVAAFSEKSTTASNIAMLITIPMALISGAFFPVSDIVIIENAFGDKPFSLFDILSSKHAANALRKVLVFNAELSAVSFELTMLLLLSGIYFTVGVLLFSRNHLRATEN